MINQEGQSKDIHSSISSFIKSTTSSSGFLYFHELNAFYKFLIAIFFCTFILKIIYHLGIFINVNNNILDMYFFWVILIVIFITFLPTKRSIF
jgi:hypothetical protein